MSTTPKGPKDDGNAAGPGGGNAPRPNLNQTFLGVAPSAQPQKPSAPPQKPSAPPQKSSESGSAIIAAPMIAISGSKSAEKAAPPKAQPTPVPGASPTSPAPNLGGGWQSSNVAPGHAGVERTLMQAGPPANPTPAPRPATRSPFPRPESKPPWAAGQPKPGGSDPHRTALSSEYLRNAREAALGGLSPHAMAPQSVPPQTVPPQTLPPQTVPPETPPPQAMAHVPIAARHAAPAVSPSAAHEASYDPMTGPRSVGTQFSVAPPSEGSAEPPRAVARTVPQPIVSNTPPAPAVSPVPVAPQMQPAPRSIAGTMLEPAPSVARPGTQPPAPVSAFAAPASSPAGGFATRFEPVPSVRGPFSEQSPVPIAPSSSLEHSADWSRQDSLKAASTVAKKSSSSASSQGRLVALAAVALGAIGFAAFGEQLMGGTAAVTESTPQPRPAEPARAAEQALPGQTALANHPTSDNLARPSAGVAAPPPSALPTGPAAISAEPPAEKGAKAVPGAEAEDVAEPADDAASATASPESQLAASAGRHVVAGRYAEALPLYQELKQKWPKTTAYAAMVRILEQKVGAGTVAPAAAPATDPPKNSPPIH